MRFAPEAWAKTYFEWMRNIHDWCISRQLWWGHRIPAFTCANGHVTVADEDPAACATCGSGKLEQDPDVLDTWFSSQLWPFSVFGWPEQTPDLADFYPTDVLVTGYDILFFWVARMIMAGLRFTGKAPFRTVHLHGLVRVGGEKMSKTKGNVIDPLEVIEEFGADARALHARLRGVLGADGLGRARPDGRLAQLRDEALERGALHARRSSRAGASRRTCGAAALSLPDRWILSRLDATAAAANAHLEAFRFDEAAGALYGFLWHELCDGYLEMVKPVLNGDDASGRGVGARRPAPVPLGTRWRCCTRSCRF